MPNNDLSMLDERNLKGMIIQHIHLFQTTMEAFATDKGYYAKDNEQLSLD
jgi:hypothetical protein